MSQNVGLTVNTANNSAEFKTSEKNIIDLTGKSFKDLTEFEKEAVMKRLKEVGIHQTAKDFHTHWQLVVTVRKRSGENNITPLKKNNNSAKDNYNKKLLKENSELKQKISDLLWQVERLKSAINELID